MEKETKVCSKCGLEKPLSEFGNVKGKNGLTYKVGACKACTAEYKKGKHQEHKEEEYERLKERRKTAEYKEKAKQKYVENKEDLNAKRREKYTENREKINDNRREYREKKKEEINKQKREWYNKNKESLQEKQREKSKIDREYAGKNAERMREYFKTHKEQCTQKMKEYRHTSRGREVCHGIRQKRRLLGYSPINKWFEGAEFHHLRYRDEKNNLDNDVGIFIPAFLHKSVQHNGNTGRNMRKMNYAALEWYINNTPKSKITTRVFTLYAYYKQFI